MPELVFFSGTMDCGKSTLALQIEHNRSARGLAGMIFTRDDRAGEGKLSSRLGLVTDAVEVEDGQDLYAYVVDHLSQGGFDDKTLNPAEIFFVVKDAADAIQAAFGQQSDKTGGFLSPSMAVKGLSRIVGPVGGTLNELHLPSAGQVDPTSYFAGIGLSIAKHLAAERDKPSLRSG